MIDSHQNEVELLSELTFALEMSQGDFRLFLASCNNQTQRRRLMEKLQTSFSGDLATLEVDGSVEKLYTTIGQHLGEQQPDAFMVWGLESNRNIDKLLVSMGLVREEFKNNYQFPILLWIDQEISRKFIRLIPDFESWTSLTVFETTTQELKDFIHQTSESVIQKILESGEGIFLDCTDQGLAESTYQELLDAQQELTNRGISLESELEASLEFVLGWMADNSTKIARDHYERSLELWQQLNNPLRVAHTYYYLGLWWQTYGFEHKAEKNMAYEKACSYFQQVIEGFEIVNRRDLVAKFINAWGTILQTLKRWDELNTVGNRAIELHKAYSYPFREARAYNFLAEFELANSNYKQAKKIAETAIKIFNKTLNSASSPTSNEDKKTLDLERYYHQGRYLFSLAKAEKGNGEIKSAIATLELAKDRTNPQYNHEFYINIITELREISYQQKEYLKAFELKQEIQKIEQQFGLIAFVGANRLRDIKENINLALPQSKQRINQQKITQEIAASGREIDVQELLEKISRPDHKLIVIYGESGVGKSSILQAGLVPSLEAKPINTRDVVVVLQRVYVNWISELGKNLAEKLQIIADLKVNSESLNSPEAIFAQLENNGNDKLNLLTVIIFDQFEEFFFANMEPKDKRLFAEFLQKCLEIPFVKIVFSLREDYIHYLLEFNRLGDLDAINNNILDKSILYYLGNFSPDKAKLVIQGLTANSQFKMEINLIEKLVADLGKESGEIRPIELQVIGAQLQKDNITTLAKYQELGDNPKVELVERYLESVVMDCGEENHKLASLVLFLLTNENNTRPLKTKVDLVKESKFNSEELELVLNIFVGSGLVFLLPEKQAALYQLVHDYLVGFIRRREGNDILEQLKQEQEKRQQLHETLEKLKQEQEKRQRLQKWVVRGSVAASLVMAVLTQGMTILALRERKASKEAVEASKEAVEARTNSYINNSRVLSLSGEPLDGLMAAMKARQTLVDNKSLETYYESKITDALRLALDKPNKDNQFREKNRSQGHSDKRDKNDQFREINRIQGHENEVYGIAFSPDGETIASASGDNTVKLWNRQGKLLQTLTGHENSVYGIAFSPDGETIASASFDKTVKLWNRQGKLLQTLTGHENSVYGIAFSPDGETIASASGDKTVKLWNRQGKLLQTLTGHENCVEAVAFSPDGETIASGSWDKTVKLWNRQGKLLQTITGHENWVEAVAFSPDGETIATASRDNTVKLWNRQGKLLQTITGHENWVEAVAFSPDGETIATASRDKTVKLWNRQGKLLQTLTGHDYEVYGIAFSPDGKTIASASGDKTVKLWKRQEKLLQTITGHENWVEAVAFSPDGETIATASLDKTVKLWNRQGKLLQTLTGHENWVNGIAFSPDGETIASASGDKTVKLWNRQGKLLQTLTGHNDEVWGIAFSPDGETIATASRDKTVKLWNRQGKLLQTLTGHENWVNGIAFSPDGETIASASADKTVKLWNRQGKLLQTLIGHENSVIGIAFSPDGETIATASRDNTVKLWNRQGKLLQTLTGHKNSVYGIAFSPDGETIATASRDNTVKLWNRQGKLLQTLTGHESSVEAVAFSPDGKTIATASADKTVKLWTGWRIEDLTKRGCQWLNDYLISHPQELEELEICQTDKHKELAASSWVIEGEKLAREGKVKEAVATFKKALKWNPDLKLNQNFKGLAASLAEAERLMEEGTTLAEEEKIEAAVEKYQRAKELDQIAFIPTWQNLDPEAKARYQAVDALLNKGLTLVTVGEVKEAIASYQKAEKIDSDQISALTWNRLCWYGSLYQKAADVMFACEKAVALSPKDGDIIESRGLARALTGDIEGAIADFQVYVNWTSNEEKKAQRQEWIKVLQTGGDPFTDKLLKELR